MESHELDLVGFQLPHRSADRGDFFRFSELLGEPRKPGGDYLINVKKTTHRVKTEDCVPFTE